MQPLALIAGDGGLPAEIARGARRRGRRVLGVGFVGITDAALAAECDQFCWLPLGQLDALASVVRSFGAREGVMAGKVAKSHLMRGSAPAAPIQPDASALALVSQLRDRADDTVLCAIASWLAQRGLVLLPQQSLVPELVPGPGVLGEALPSERAMRDVQLAWRAAKALAAIDVGQTAVALNGAVLALEALEGTDAAIRRAGLLGGPGASVVKVAKPSQDPRFDVPVIGLETLRAVREIGAACLAFEARATLVLNAAELAAAADEARIAVIGIGAEGPCESVMAPTQGDPP
jgi:DUF1009 family protein